MEAMAPPIAPVQESYYDPATGPSHAKVGSDT
jgi:hypothetical protein